MIEKRIKRETEKRLRKTVTFFESVTPLYAFVMTMNMKAFDTVFNNRPNKSRCLYWIYSIVFEWAWARACLFSEFLFISPLNIDNFVVDSRFSFFHSSFHFLFLATAIVCLYFTYIGTDAAANITFFPLFTGNNFMGVSRMFSQYISTNTCLYTQAISNHSKQTNELLPRGNVRMNRNEPW